MRRRWTCARWRRAGSSSALLLAFVLAGCGGGGHDRPKTTAGVTPPKVRSSDACPVARPATTTPRFGPALGPGPAYPALTIQAQGVIEFAPPKNFDSRAWAGQKVLWVVRPGAPQGLVVTGVRLDAPGEVRFDDGDVPAARLELPAPDAKTWAERPGYTRVRRGGCYAYVVRGPGVSEAVVFRAVRLAHWNSGGDHVRGRSARALERAIVEPRAGERNGLSVPNEAGCRAPTARELRRDPFGNSRSVFSCSITDSYGTRRYDVQVLANWCYIAELRRRPGEHTRGIQACR